MQYIGPRVWCTINRLARPFGPQQELRERHDQRRPSVLRIGSRYKLREKIPFFDKKTHRIYLTLFTVLIKQKVVFVGKEKINIGNKTYNTLHFITTTYLLTLCHAIMPRYACVKIPFFQFELET